MRVRVLLFLLAISLIATSTQASLRAYWAFEEGSGDYALDSSGNGNTGLLVADTEAGDPATPLPGPTTQPDRITSMSGYGEALQFCAGTDNYNSVWIDKSDSLKDLGSTWSMTMWLRQDSRDTSPGGGGGYQRVMSNPNYEIEMGVPSWEYDYFWPYDNPGLQTDIGATYLSLGGDLGDWYHMAVTFDGTYLKKYLNGTEVYSMDFSGQSLIADWDTPGWNDAVMKLACQTWPNKDWFRGAMDDVAIWGDEYLDSDQVMGLYDGTYTPLTVPEPLTIVLFGIGGLLLRKRR